MTGSDFVYWAVRQGHNKGLFLTLEDCGRAVKGYHGAQYHGFENIDDARAYLDGKDPNELISERARKTTEEKGKTKKMKSRGLSEQGVLVYPKDDDDDGAIETMSRVSSHASLNSIGDKTYPPQAVVPLKAKGLEAIKFDVRIKFLCMTGIQVENPDSFSETTVACAVRIIGDKEEGITTDINKFYYGSKPLDNAVGGTYAADWTVDSKDPRLTGEANFTVDLAKSNVSRSSESVHSICAFIPANVNLEIGTMKYRDGASGKDEFVRLGTTSLLINGDERRLGVMYDLSIRPIEDAQDVIYSQYSLRRYEEKRKKKILGVFKKRGSKKSLAVDDSDAKKIKLSRSSILRVKVEVKPFQSIGPIIPKMLDPGDVSDDEKSQFEVVDEVTQEKVDVETRKKIRKELATTPPRSSGTDKAARTVVTPRTKKRLQKEKWDNLYDDDRGGTITRLIENLREGCALMATDVGFISNDILDDEIYEPYSPKRDAKEVGRIVGNFAKCEDLNETSSKSEDFYDNDIVDRNR